MQLGYGWRGELALRGGRTVQLCDIVPAVNIELLKLLYLPLKVWVERVFLSKFVRLRYSVAIEPREQRAYVVEELVYP